MQSGYASPVAEANGTATVVITSSLADLTDAELSAVKYDPDLLAMTGSTQLASFTVNIGTTSGEQLNRDNLIAIDITDGKTGNDTLVRRLTTIDGDTLTFYVTSDLTACGVGTADPITASMPIKDTFTEAQALGGVVGDDPWGLENNAAIPEIDIKVDSIAVTAVTKKLKAKWSPELGQDLNAYHNLDAEVELTSILSEQIALEIDQ